jgi:hypothetical protein
MQSFQSVYRVVASQKGQKMILSIMLSVLIISSGVSLYYKIKPSVAPQILYNQLGYLPSMEKIFLVDYGTSPENTIQSYGSFEIFDENGDKVINNRPLIYMGELWQRFYAYGNFSDIIDLGTYKIEVITSLGDIISSPFEISWDCYSQVMERAINFYYYERCGQDVTEIVPGYVGHALCHFDDGINEEVNRQHYWHDLSGGWHDAGDYGKYTEDPLNTQFSVYMLAYTYQMTSDYWNETQSKYDTPAPDVVDEAVWGSKFLQKMIILDDYNDTRMCVGIFAKKPNGEYDRFGYWGSPDGETDNIPNTGDERTIGSLWNVSGMTAFRDHEFGYDFVNTDAAMMTAAAIANTAITANYYHYWDDQVESPRNLIDNATALYHSHISQILNTSNEVEPNRDIDDYWTALLCITALAKWANITGNLTSWTQYQAEGWAIRNFLLTQGMISNLYPNFNAFSLTPQLELFALWQFELLVNGIISNNVTAAFQSWMEYSLRPACNATGNYFHVVKAPDSYFSCYGINMIISSVSAISSLAAHLIDLESVGSIETQWMYNYAFDNVCHWIMGRSPFGICQIESLGVKNPSIYHNRYMSIPGNPRGAVPGTIPNGIALPPAYVPSGNDECVIYQNGPDLPYYDLRLPNPEFKELGSYRSNEVYISDNAMFLFGFATTYAFAT